MTDEQQTVLIIKGTIADMPEADRQKIMEAYQILKTMINENPLTGMAIALLGAELAAL